MRRNLASAAFRVDDEKEREQMQVEVDIDQSTTDIIRRVPRLALRSRPPALPSAPLSKSCCWFTYPLESSFMERRPIPHSYCTSV